MGRFCEEADEHVGVFSSGRGGSGSGDAFRWCVMHLMVVCISQMFCYS